MVLSFERASNDPLAPLLPQVEETLPTYAVLLSKDPTTGRYRATVPDLPGFACEGNTPEEATAIIRDAVTAWMHAAQGNGLSVPPPLEHRLETIQIGSEAAVLDTRSAAEQFAEVVSKILDLTESARREFLIAEAAVMDDRFTDATRHVEWSTDLLLQAGSVLSGTHPRGPLERVYKLLEYGISRSRQGARLGLQGTCEQNVECVGRAEEFYVQGIEAIKSALGELRRFVLQS